MRYCGTELGPALAGLAVHVHLCAPERQTEASFSLAWSSLDAVERGRADGFVHATDRLHYVVAHGLLRAVLARHARVPANQITFTHTAHGRPELGGSLRASGLRFNLAHTSGLVGCAVVMNRDVGFDLELVRRPAPLEIAARCFSAPELESLRAQPAAQQHDHFYSLWTLKEAYAKARGLGLAQPFREFAVELQANGQARLARQPPDDPGPWALSAWRLAEHWAALAVRAAAAVDPLVFHQQQLEP